MAAPVIALTTDFGWGSSYVAQLKGVLLSALPHAHLIDVNHDITAFSLRHAEVSLRGTAFAFPQGTTHLVVVDPGVGTARRPLAVAAGGMHFVGPDNGVLGWPLATAGARCVHLCRPHLFRQPVSPTFHGRDIFAPVAAELAAGVDLPEVGEPVADAVPSSLPRPTFEATRVRGETLWADRFGNLISNLPAHCVDRSQPAMVRDGSRAWQASWARTYGDGLPGQLLAIVGSDGFVELALREGSALGHIGGESVVLECMRNMA